MSPSRPLAVAVAAALIPLSAFAGDLNPPAGPVAPTMKPLSDVEPRTIINAANTPGDADSLFKITQPGSYYLTGNITGVAGKHGIEIAASGVTLDLSGFDLVGVPAMGAFDGVSVSDSSVRGIAVVNGAVRNWGDRGVQMSGMACRVERIVASGNAGFGIALGNSCVASHCSAAQNAGGGITASFGCIISNCSGYVNTGPGIIATGTTNTVTACSAHANGGAGISVGIGCTVSNCSTSNNTGVGIVTAGTCVVSGCSVQINAGGGIFVDSSCTVQGCSVRASSADGILCNAECTIRDNTCSLNGLNASSGANIHATGARNRIEGNNCAGADRGIEIDAAGNIIIRNVCAGNTTDWDIAGNNVYGPILDRRAPAAAPVSGFSAAGSLGSTDANANFSY